MPNNPAIIAPNFGAPLVFSGHGAQPALPARGGRPQPLPAELYSSALVVNRSLRAYVVVPPAPMSSTMLKDNGWKVVTC